MKRPPPLPPDTNEELSTLIATLHAAGRRLEELTGGEVDAVADREGRTFLLGRAQEELRHVEAARQAAILNALPAHIALLDRQGLIISVNEAWRRSGSAAAMGSGHATGTNYLEICESAQGEGADDAHHAAEGIRLVLAGGVPSFSIEYPSHSPTEQRWFLLSATPVTDGDPTGAVVMRTNITQRRRTQVALAQSEAGLYRAQLMAKLAHVITGPDGSFETWSANLPQLIGPEPAQVPRSVRAWMDFLRPEDRSLLREKAVEARAKTLRVELEYRLRKPDGQEIHIRQTMEPLKGEGDAAGWRWFNTLQDITDSKQAVHNLRESEARFRSLTQLSSDWFWEQDGDYRFVKFSGGDRVDGWGVDQDKAVGLTRWDLPTIEPLSGSWNEHKALLEEHKPFRDFEYRRTLASGVLQYVAASGEPIFDAGGGFTGYRGVATDITERKLDEIRITRLNRVYAVLSGINTLIVRARDRDELFREACRVAVEAGRFHMSWIGVVDRSAMQVVPAASAGVLAGGREELRHRLSLHPDPPVGYGPAGMAVNDRQAVVVNDVRTDSRIHHKKALADRGVRSLVILPLLVADEPVAIFVMHATEAGYFDEAEMKLLRELAGNLSFALDHVEKEKKLKDSESRFRQMAENISDVFFLQNLDSSQIYYVSPAYEKIWGRTCESLYANPASWGESIHAEDLAHAFKSFDDGRNTGFDYEFRIARPDGEIRWIHTRGFPILDDAGKPYRTAGVASDITQRKQVSDALRESERRFSDLLANVELASLMLDADARITYCNDYLLQLSGWRRDEVIGRDWFELFMPPGAGEMKPTFQALLANRPEALHHENEILTRSGGRRLIRWSNSVLRSAAGAVVGTASIGEDITEHAMAHERLLEASHQRGMAEVATSVLHNVGNVLNSVNVSASLVVENVRNSRAAGLAKVAALVREHEADLGSYMSSDPKGRHIPALLEQLAQDWLGQQQVVAKELDSLRSNIDHIREIVALQQGHAKVTGSIESISIRDLVEDSLRMNADSLVKHEIRIVREFEDVSPISLEKHKVLQILVNLVRNAKQACNEMQGVEKCMTLRIAQVDGRVRISVGDNGAGIAPENLTRIFAHGFTTRKDGHGFGLHSGALAATQLGGSLSARSEGPGKGATFTLELARQSPGIPG